MLLSNKHLLRTGRAYFPWRRACPPKWCCMVTLGCHTHDRPPDWLPPSMRRCPAAPDLTQRALLPAGATLPANDDPEYSPTLSADRSGQPRAITVWHRMWHGVINLAMLGAQACNHNRTFRFSVANSNSSADRFDQRVCGLQECWQQLHSV